MPDTTNQLYTYRNGKKVYLKKEPDQFVVRATPEFVESLGVGESMERVSPHTIRVVVASDELNPIMDEMRNEAVTHHAYRQEINDAEFLITDRIMITFREAVSNEVLSAFMAKYALILMSQYSDREYLLQLTDQTGMNPLKLVVLINETESALVESCEHDLNKRMTVSSINIPVDTKYTQQWHLHSRLTHASFDARASSNCEPAWQLLDHFGNSEVVIAVSDDGCKLDHTDFDSVNKFAQWAYMQGNILIHRDSISASPQNMYQSGSDHGTCCSGVIAAEIDGTIAVGAAPGCRLLPVKWESSGSSLFISDSKLMTVLSFISDKADVFSNSWGSSPESNYATNVVNKIAQLAQTGGRRGKGIVFLWAAGNDNCPIKYSGNLDVPYDDGYNSAGSWVGVNTSREFEHNLIGVPGVMYVAALASNAQRSHYSNYGEGISICAPSSNSHAYWRMAVTGLGILTSSGKAPFFDSSFGGTSSATPLVAGIAGLVISANPNLTAIQVISILQKTADKNLNMTGYAQTPPRPNDTNTSWDISPVSPHNTGNFINIGHPDGTWSGWFGFGKVNAAAAVAEALRISAPVTGNTIVLSQISSPGLAIPDNNAVGIANSIMMNHAGTVISVKLDIDITHTYIGDLSVKLSSPKGTTISLHERNGGNSKNIIKTFDIQSTPALSIYNGEPCSGNWILKVIDAAAVDIGKLNKWTLYIETLKALEVKLEESPGVTIPDNNPAGIERSLNATDNGTIKEIQVSIDITHTYISDLIVNLVSPNGTVISLHSRTGASADNIIRDFDIINLPDLMPLIGQPMNGIWKLRVSDVVGQDIGKLNKWAIKIVKA